MRFKKMMRGIALLLMTVLLSVSVCPLVSHADKISDLKKSIQDKQDAIDKAQNEKKALQSGLTDVKKVISGLQTSKQNLSNYISQLDDSLSQAQARILELNTMITDKEAEITKTAAELEDAIATEETQYQAMKDRIKFIYEKGDSFYLEMVLTAESFGEMLNKAEYVEKLSAYDKRMLEQYQATRQYVAVCKEQLEAEQELLQEAKTDVEKEQKSLETLISQKEQEITAYESDINNQQALVKEYEAEIAAQNAEIKAMEDLVAAQKAELAKENKAARTYGGATGLTLLIQRSFELFFQIEIPYTIVNVILNIIPIYIGFRFIGKKFTLYSCLCIMLTNILTDIIPGFAITYDTLLISIFGGLINGFVISLCLWMNATTGGTDFIAIYFSEKKGIDSFNIVLGMNAIILIAAGILFGWDKALYSIIFQYTSTQVLHVLYKQYQQNTLFIVTNRAEEVIEAIAQLCNHGATIMDGEGSYEHHERKVVYSVVSSAECKHVLSAIKEVDPKAFVNVIKTEQISGHFYQRPHE